MTGDVPALGPSDLIRTGWTPYKPPPAVAYEDEPINRVYCLDIAWLDCAGTVRDPMPTRCTKHWGHDGPHQAHGHDGKQGVTWEDESVEGAA